MTLLMVVTTVLVACKRVPPPDQNPGNLMLRGRVAASAGNKTPGAIVSPLGAEAAVKVIVTSGNGYAVHDVVDGAFSFPVPTDRPAGLVLVGPMDEYLGFVMVHDSIPGVPVQAVDDGVSSIDLGMLAASGTVVSPGIDPIGHGITLDEAEITALSELGVIARDFLADPDVDDDGVIDLLQAREYRPQIAVFRNSTFVGLVGQPVGPVVGWSLGVNVADPSAGGYPSSAIVTGPVGSGVDAVTTPGMMGNSQNILYGIPLLDPSQQPTPGIWTLAYGDRTLSFDIADLSSLAASAPSLEPTIVLNADQTIQRVDWIWRMADGTTSTASSVLASSVLVQITAGAPAVRCPASNITAFSDTTVYLVSLTPDATSHSLACQDIPWSAVQSIELSYDDVFGGRHGFGFVKP